MPSSTEQTQGAHRRIHPATVSVDELLRHLATDPTVGLSPKEAERRVPADRLPLFRRPPRRLSDCMIRASREPSLWLLMAVALISLCFERIALGVFCAALAMGNAVLCGYFLYRADRTDEAMLTYDTPLSRVLRGGRLLRLSADGLCPGDIILLAKGDIVPADCRLLRTDGLCVSERELDITDPHRPAVRRQKDAAAQPEVTEGVRLSPVNMAFAGGIVEEGSALAVVTAVGRKTHLGGLIRHVPSAHQGKPVSLFARSARFLSIYNLCLFCLIVPLTAVGIFTVGDSCEFLDIFMSALALSSLTLTEHLLAKGYHLASATRRAAAKDRDGENTAEIKSAATLERLTAMTDLILVGTAALHDGEWHPEAVYVGDRVYRCDHPDADETVQSLCEFLYLYRRGMATLPAAGQGSTERKSRLLAALCEWAELDIRGLSVKIKEIRAEGGGVSGIFPTADGNRRITVLLTDRFDEVETCTGIHDGSKRTPANREAVNALYRTYREAVRKGSTPLFLLTEDHGERTMRAMITYAPHTCRKTAGCVKNLESAGIRVTAMLHDVAETHGRVLSACGLTEMAPADTPVPEGYNRTPAAVRIAAGCRAFEGCTEDYVLSCIRDLKAEGRTVGVLAADAEDVYLLSEADVAFTCAPSLFAEAEEGIPVLYTCGADKPSADADGLPDGVLANDRARRTAHVILRRSTPVGGGLLGVLRALQASDGFKDALDSTFRFTLLSQIVRSVAVILPLCLGLSIATAPALLLSGLFVDLLVLSAALNLPLRSTPAHRRRVEAGLIRPHVTYRAELIAAAVGMALPWVAVAVASLFRVKFGGELHYVGLLCLLGLQLAIFCTGQLPRRDSSSFMTAVAMALLYVGGLALALISHLSLLWALAMPLLAPVAYLLIRLILGYALKKRKKAG